MSLVAWGSAWANGVWGPFTWEAEPTTGRISKPIYMGPQLATWEDWNGDLLHYFGEDPLPMVPEEEWRTLAYALTSLATFDNYAVPDPVLYENWQDWVSNLLFSINGPTI